MKRGLQCLATGRHFVLSLVLSLDHSPQLHKQYLVSAEETQASKLPVTGSLSAYIHTLHLFKALHLLKAYTPLNSPSLLSFIYFLSDLSGARCTRTRDQCHLLSKAAI